MKPKCYAVYRGDTFIALGTAKELGKYFNVRPETVRWWGSKSYKDRSAKQGIEAKISYVVEEDDEDDK